MEEFGGKEESSSARVWKGLLTRRSGRFFSFSLDLNNGEGEGEQHKEVATRTQGKAMRNHAGRAAKFPPEEEIRDSLLHTSSE